MDDSITALLTAAANPKLTPGPCTFQGLHRSDCAYMFKEQEFWCSNCRLTAARNGLRALAEEWLRYGDHYADCPVDEYGDGHGNDLKPCTCGWSARRQQITDYLEATKGDQNARS